MTLPTFPDADFYDTSDDRELYTHDDPEEALRYFLDDQAADIADMRALAPVTVYCFRRKRVTPADAEACARQALESAETYLDESDEYNGGDDPMLDEEHRGEVLAAFRAAVDLLIARSTVWQVESFAEVEINADQLEAFAREAFAP